MTISPEQYLAAMTKIAETGETPALETVRELLAFDPNTLYRLGPGHANNLLEDALSRIDELNAQLDAAIRDKQTAINRANHLALITEGTTA